MSLKLQSGTELGNIISRGVSAVSKHELRTEPPVETLPAGTKLEASKADEAQSIENVFGKPVPSID